jgi:hypothetical protein
MSRFHAYRDGFPNARLNRSKSGVLEVALHTDGGTLVFNGHTHEQFVDLFHAIGSDPDNRILILTGSGDAFMETISPEGFDFFTPHGYDKIYREGRKVLMNNSRHRGTAYRRGQRPGAAALRIYPARRYRAGHDAETAKEWGAVNEIVPPNELLPRAREIAEGLAKLSPLTTKYTRIGVTQKLRRDEGVTLGLALEGISAADVARASKT